VAQRQLNCHILLNITFNQYVLIINNYVLIIHHTCGIITSDAEEIALCHKSHKLAHNRVGIIHIIYDSNNNQGNDYILMNKNGAEHSLILYKLIKDKCVQISKRITFNY